jgi:hypothetical protein
MGEKYGLCYCRTDEFVVGTDETKACTRIDSRFTSRTASDGWSVLQMLIFGILPERTSPEQAEQFSSDQI